MRFLIELVFAGVFFALGYWVASHPTDARDLSQRVRDAIGRMIHRSPS